jgi:beta-lactamase regulating signal transducer with metallopeptidase domain
MSTWIPVIGWTLIAFTWQGGLLWVATAAGLRICRRRSSHARYAVACVGLAAMVIMPLVTAADLWAARSAVAAQHESAAADEGSQVDSRGASLSAGDHRTSPTKAGPALSGQIDRWSPVIVWGWLIGVSAFTARLAGGCWRVRRLRTACEATSVSSWQAAAERLAGRLHMDTAFRVIESNLVDTPTVIGWVRPLILVPIAALTNLPAAQLEAVLVHELAHIRRRDYAVNLLQSVAETLLFYHPGVWWVSARIREEREHCCDDLAVVVCGQPAVYAEALLQLAAWQTRHHAPAVAVTDGPLLARVQRLLSAADVRPRPVAGLVILVSSAVVATGIVAHTSGAGGTPLSSGPRSRLESRSVSPLLAGSELASAASPQPTAGERRLRSTDHFDISYPSDLDVHAERVGREAERAYERVSGDLLHNLAFKVPMILFHTSDELEREKYTAGAISVIPRPRQNGGGGTVELTTSVEPSRDRVLLAMDVSADQWQGLITHEVTHVFGFDIIPGFATPKWIVEGLAEYERGAWDPNDLVVLRDAVRANAIPRISDWLNEGGSSPRFVYALGHAAFDWIESRWGRSGVRQFLFWLRQVGITGDPYERALQIRREEFDRSFDQYVKAQFGRVGQSLAERFDLHASRLRLEGRVLTTDAQAAVGRACLELWVTNPAVTERWAVECGEADHDVVQRLRPGDRVVVTGAPAQTSATHRMVMRDLVRPADGFSWRGHSD